MKKKKEHLNKIEKNHVNFTDVDASLIKGRDGSMPQYNGQSVVCGENKMLLLLQATEDVNDTNQLEPMLEQTKEEYGAYPDKCRTDTGYYKTETLQQVEQKGIDCYCAIPRTTQRKVVLDENGQAIEFIYE